MVQNNDFTGFGFSYGMSEAIKAAYGNNNYPNPAVGSALISKEGNTMLVASHIGRNSDHSEVSLIKQINNSNINTLDSTLYITLEPCMHTDTSPSCAAMIVESELFKRIVIGDIDPDCRTNGKGYEYIASSGIDVDIESGVTRFLDPGYMRRKKLETESVSSINESPIAVITKVATSNDNYIYSDNNTNTYITDEDSRKLVHYLRGTVDAIIVGKNTLIIDKPRLDIRHNIKSVVPITYILWGKNDNEYEEYLSKYPNFNFIITFDHRDERSHNIPNLSPKSITAYLNSLGVYSLLVEGGNTTWETFLNISDSIYVFKSNHNLGSGIKLINNLRNNEIETTHCLTREIKVSKDTLSIYTKKL